MIKENLISKNQGIGLFLRDNSEPLIEENELQANQIDIAVEKKSLLQKNIREKNLITGDIKIPEKTICNIF